MKQTINHWFVLIAASGFFVLAILLGFLGLGGVGDSFAFAGPALILAVIFLQIWRKRLCPTEV